MKRVTRWKRRGRGGRHGDEDATREVALRRTAKGKWTKSLRRERGGHRGEWTRRMRVKGRMLREER